ncbi:hypothetical protein GUJ93_ZPchr0004g39536 [Zizania palustris]|uniref:Serine hydrolase domain-containing protein n=1 Tax=Zizania palustris TaxID=103762 RepID=A0A8J5SPY8_ZIZPA|nr:hypothetical protein GUJ93_ZPchr0004g39536 [Zizania palustris]
MPWSLGLALTKVPKIKYLIIIGGAKFLSPTVAEKAYANKIKCPSVHFLGDNDFLKTYGEKLVESYVDPFIIRHPKGHTVPRLDEKSLEVMLRFLDQIEETAEAEADHSSSDVDEQEFFL